MPRMYYIHIRMDYKLSVAMDKKIDNMMNPICSWIQLHVEGHLQLYDILNDLYKPIICIKLYPYRLYHLVYSGSYLIWHA